MRTPTGGGLPYWTFLNPRSDSIFRALCLCFLDERFLTRDRQGRSPPIVCRPLTSHSPNLLTARPTACLRSVPMWIQFHSAHTLAVFLLTQLEHPVPEIPDWQLKGQHTNPLYPISTCGHFLTSLSISLPTHLLQKNAQGQQQQKKKKKKRKKNHCIS